MHHNFFLNMNMRYQKNFCLESVEESAATSTEAAAATWTEAASDSAALALKSSSDCEDDLWTCLDQEYG